jgi:hypothetical protein
MKELDQILSGEGCTSENKIVKWATYATSAIVIGGVVYAVYKGIKNSREIEALQSQIQRGIPTTAPLNEEVVDI